MDVLLSIIIALVVFGVFVAVAKFCIQKFFPELPTFRSYGKKWLM